MGLLAPTPTPYAPLEWVKKPLPERARMACEAWAAQGYGAPIGIYVVYLVKVALYVLGWALFCGTSPALGGLSSIARWWLHPIAFEKAIVWSMFFEVLGLGCGSGPLTARYFPPVGGFLYFLRPGTTKLPFFPGAPIIGTKTRTILDVLLYAALLVASVMALVAPELGMPELLPLVILVPLLGILDKTLFLAARSEHYWVTIVVLAFGSHWIAGAKAVQLALWFWAGFSKLNHHFPAVACVMTSNAPLVRIPAMRRAMYRDYPTDLRPSTLATWMAHVGTALELGVPLAFVLTPTATSPVVAMALMIALHAYITSNVPMGVPLEWNVMVVYGSFALFWAHPDVTVTSLTPWPIALFLGFMLVALPLIGNLVPSAVSFLLAMRYYAGNWGCSIWLFRGESYRKLDKLKKTSPWVLDQLARFYDRATSVGLLGKIMAFRMMHLHGRALSILVPKAVERIEEYEWVDGELVAGLALGWNFGEGHLHQEQLLASLQAQCGFEEGELRCVFIESQPLGRSSLAYRVVDAKTGNIDVGTVAIEALRARQPWGVAAGES